MSEPIGMSIEIGGDLPESLAEELLGKVIDELGEIGSGPPNMKSLKAESGKSTITWAGTSNYGECEDLKAFLENNNIGYIHHYDACYEYNAGKLYWVPGMKEAKFCTSDQDGTSLANIDHLRPVCDLMLALLKQGPDALPLFLGNERLKDIVQKGLKNKGKLHAILKKRIDTLLPVIPTLPVFRIVKGA